MKSKTKLSILFFIVAVSMTFANVPKALAVACPGDVLQFFPESNISSVIGKVKSTTGSSSGIVSSCNFTIDAPIGGSASVSLTKFRSPAQAKSSFQSSFFGTKMGIGDDSSFKNGSDSAVLKDQYIFKVSWYCFCTAKKFLTEEQAKSLLKYSIEQIGAADKPQPPVINLITPASVPAGMETGIDRQTGIALYTDAEIKNFTIRGTNLQGAKLSVPKDMYGRDMARFVAVQISADGTSLMAWVYVSAGAPAGKNKITLTNSANLSASAEITVTLTGTQYLKRKFTGSRVQFRGDWPETAPNPEVLEIEKGIHMGLTAIDKPAYKNLGININVFAKDYWVKSGGMQLFCGNKTTTTIGCSYGTSSVINISSGFGKMINGSSTYNFGSLAAYDDTDARYIASEILHESAHKLDNCYGGAYFAGFISCIRHVDFGFGKEWTATMGDKSKCKYLPLTSDLAWNDGTKRVPHCGFARSYSATAEAEDVATMTDIYYFYPELLKTGDGLTDPRYQQKINILKRYGFI